MILIALKHWIVLLDTFTTTEPERNPCYNFDKSNLNKIQQFHRLSLRLSSFENASKIQSGKQRKSQRVFIKHAGVEKRRAALCGTKHKTKIGTEWALLFCSLWLYFVNPWVHHKLSYSVFTLFRHPTSALLWYFGPLPPCQVCHSNLVAYSEITNWCNVVFWCTT